MGKMMTTAGTGISSRSSGHHLIQGPVCLIPSHRIFPVFEAYHSRARTESSFILRKGLLSRTGPPMIITQ